MFLDPNTNMYYTQDTAGVVQYYDPITGLPLSPEQQALFVVPELSEEEKEKRRLENEKAEAARKKVKAKKEKEDSICCCRWILILVPVIAFIIIGIFMHNWHKEENRKRDLIRGG